MSGRCASCRHWVKVSGSTHDEDGALVAPGKATWPLSEWPRHRRFAECVAMGSVDGEPSHSGTLAFATDESCYRASVWTDAEFGCVMHEERD